jgi:outer membrane protein assembly factor BamB
VNLSRVSLVIALIFVLLACSSSFLFEAEGANSVIQNTLVWNNTMPTYEVTNYDFHNYWSSTVAQPFGQPIVVNGVVFVSNSRGRDRGLYAYDAYSGQKLWNYSYVSVFTVSDGVVYVTSNRGLLALRASDGSKIWNYSELRNVQIAGGGSELVNNARFHSSPAVVNGVVYDVSDYGNLMAFNSANGALLWNKYIQGNSSQLYGSFTSPVVDNGVLFVGCQDHNVYALSASDGQRIWNFSTNNEVYAPLTVADNVVYVCSYDSNVYALNATNGEKQWNFTLAPNKQGYCFIDSAPVVSGSLIYVGGGDGMVYAINRSDGSEQWSFNNAYAIRSSLSILDGFVYFGSEGSKLYALDAQSGTLIWSFTADYSVKYVTACNGALYVGTGAGSIFALGSPPPTPQESSRLVLIVAVILAIVTVVCISLVFYFKYRR